MIFGVITIAIVMLSDLFRFRTVKIIDETEIYSERELSGLAWLVITSEEQAKAIEKKHGIIFPSNDYSENYLLECQGRKMKSLRYNKVSKYEWEYDVPVGIEEFIGEINPHAVYVYRINKVKIKQDGD